MSDFDCDLKREIERVKRKRNCADFNSQKLSRFHADVGAQTTTKVPSIGPSNATTNHVTLSQQVLYKSTTQAKKHSAMSIKQRLMNDSGKIFKIVKREIKPSADKAKLNEWLAQNKKQPIKRKFSEDQREFQTHINSKRVKMTQHDTERGCVQIQSGLQTPLNIKHAAKKSLIPRPIHSVKGNHSKQSSVIPGKQTDTGNVHNPHSRWMKHLSALGTETKVHKSLIPTLMKPVNKQTPDNHIIKTNTKPTLLNSKQTFTSHEHAPTYSVTYNRVKPIHADDIGSVKPTSSKSIQTASSRGKQTSLKVNKPRGVNVVKPSPCKSSEYTLVKSMM